MSSETPNEKVGPEEQRLVDLYRELMLEVRWRRDQEARFLTLFVSALSIIVAGLFVFLTKAECSVDREPVLRFAIVATAILILFTWIKVFSDHWKQRSAAKGVVWLWEHWHFLPPKDEATKFPLSERARKFGRGFGWLISLLFVTGLGASVICFALGFFHHC